MHNLIPASCLAQEKKKNIEIAFDLRLGVYISLEGKANSLELEVAFDLVNAGYSHFPSPMISSCMVRALIQADP